VAGRTLVEKILARCADQPSTAAGDDVLVRPDFVHAYELKGTTDIIAKDIPRFGNGRVPFPERFAIYIDHRVPAKTPDQEAFHEETRAWSKQHGMALYDREGIGHQVAVEKGYAVPGSFGVHADGHVSQLGAFSALAIGVRSNVIEAFVRERIRMTVPRSTRIVLEGRLRPGVMGRDAFHHLLYRYGPEFAAFEAIEFAGPGCDTLTTEARQTICGLAMFTGAVTAIFHPTPHILSTVPAARIQAHVPLPDEDADYSKTLEVDLADIEPMLVLPPSPANAEPLSRHLGIPLNAGHIGSCVSGRTEDLQAAAEILRGKRIVSSFSLHVVPTSQRILAAAAQDGSLAALVEAGAFVSSPSCDFCSGNIATMSQGQRAISTGTLNVPGRMGHVDSEIFLASAATVAASALQGLTTDPRERL
jgi:3-isopropylmalate/(R)-2-methylmalate dehydratase large subunit